MNANFHLFKKSERAGADKSPDIHAVAMRDWKIILAVSAILGVLIIALGSFLLWRVNQGVIFIGENDGETETLVADERALSRTVKFFDDRAARFKEFKSAPASEIDPSL